MVLTRVPASRPTSRSPPLGSPPRSSRTAPVEWTPPTWEEIVRDHSARVYRLAYRLTGTRTTPRI